MHHKRLSLLIFLSSSVGLSPSHAVIQQDLNDLKVIEAAIAQEGLTRITVQGDRIKHVFGSTGEYVLEADEDNGQVFITPTLTSFSKALSLTLTTEKGITQDLRLHPQQKAPEALLLIPQTKDECGENTKNHLTHAKTEVTQQSVKALLEACRENRIPIGYKEVPLKIIKDPPLRKGANYQTHLLRELRGGSLQALTYKVTNISSNRIYLSEAEMARAGFAQRSQIIAIQLMTSHLNPGEFTYAYIVAKAHQ